MIPHITKVLLFFFSHLGRLLTILENWAFMKIPTKGKMTTQNVRDTCNKLGYEATCYCNNGCSQDDGKCSKTVKATYTLYEVSAAICSENKNPRYWWECKPMYGICQYMYDWSSGYAQCSNEADGTTNGQSLSNKWSSCAFKL